MVEWELDLSFTNHPHDFWELALKPLATDLHGRQQMQTETDLVTLSRSGRWFLLTFSYHGESAV